MMISKFATLAFAALFFNCSVVVAQVTFSGPTTYNAGDQVSITAVLNSSDPDENGEGEPLIIKSTTGFSATDPYHAVPQGYFFIAPGGGSLSASILGADQDETASVTVSIAPSYCSTLTPTPVPTSVGCPVRILSQDQKDKLNFEAIQLQSFADTIFVADIVSATFTLGACKIPTVLFGLGLQGVAGYNAYIAAIDPSDPNFREIAQPLIPTFIPVTAQDRVTQPEADALNALMANLAEETAYLRVLITSGNRAQGAADASDAFWENTQIQTALGYAGKLGSLTGAQPALLLNLQNALALTSCTFPILAGNVGQLEYYYATAGLPSPFVQELTAFGYSAEEIEQIRQRLIAQDINAVAGDFPSVLTNSALITALRQAAQAFGLPVHILIMPGDPPPATIVARSNGKIPVAILSTPTFNAVTRVNTSSLTFGHAGNEKSFAFCDRGGQDVNGDGLADLVCHFETKLAGFRPGDVVGILKGTTIQGVPISGQAAIVIVP